MSQPLDFRFQIGDVVKHKAAGDELAIVYIIVSLLTEQCMGGEQRLYVVRGVSTGRHTMPGATDVELRTFFEFEVEAV